MVTPVVIVRMNMLMSELDSEKILLLIYVMHMKQNLQKVQLEFGSRYVKNYEAYNRRFG